MNYDDIIDLPHYEPKHHPRMSLLNRAIQFAPFAALTGHGDAIQETARHTDDLQDLDESKIDELNRKMEILRMRVKEKPKITITYFQNDEKKSGGKYSMLSSKLLKINEYEGVLFFENGASIAIHSIFDIDGKIFS